MRVSHVRFDGGGGPQIYALTGVRASEGSDAYYLPVPEHPVAYFLTFATYGSWLHGDARGSKDAEHNRLETDPRPREDFLEKYETRELRHAPFVISAEARTVIEQSFRETCRIREWSLVELNVRKQHVHLVVCAPGSPERVMSTLKSYATRDLRNLSVIGVEQHPWSRHGSTRYLWTDQDLESAIEYVANWQGRELPGSSWRKWKEERRARQ
ncbi:MAG: transposase [Dehalococcoidia bacterium]